jgi:hypothetical protein
MATPTQDPFAQFLTGGLTAAKWPQLGFVVEGTVKGAALRQQTNYDTGALEFWTDGSPRMQLVVDLQSTPTGITWKGLHNVQHAVPNDDGMRAVYVKGNLQRAVTKALRDANAQFEMGGHMRIERTQDIPNADPKKAPAHDFVVTWTAPSAEAAATDFLNTPEPAQAPIPTPAVPAPAAPANPFAAGGKPPF